MTAVREGLPGAQTPGHGPRLLADLADLPAAALFEQDPEAFYVGTVATTWLSDVSITATAAMVPVWITAKSVQP